jgi:LmbE family N-acetylglucosaminyl deacetylase
MIGIGALLRTLSLRRLRLRAEQLAALAADPLSTVYPEPFTPAGGERILVLAPHADDETFGAGGAIAAHVSAGDEVRVLLFSDNTDSVHPDITPDEARALRADEFHRALDALGARVEGECRIPPGAFSRVSDTAALRSALIGFQPHVLYLPSLFDNHTHHRVVVQWAAQELSACTRTTMRVRGYEVWTPLPATTVIDISAHIETKRNAIRCYLSQMYAIDYEHHILGLNAYRAMTLSGARHAEAFHETPASRFITLVRQHLSV